MTDLALRVAVAGGVAVLALLGARLAARHQRSAQPKARVSGLDVDAAVIAFTSTDCPTCRKMMRRLGDLGVPIREVTHELEPDRFEAAGVEGVPLIVVMTPGGSPTQQLAGTVSTARLRRAVARAGW